jgi:hypothetical protein
VITKKSPLIFLVICKKATNFRSFPKAPQFMGISKKSTKFNFQKKAYSFVWPASSLKPSGADGLGPEVAAAGAAEGGGAPPLPLPPSPAPLPRVCRGRMPRAFIQPVTYTSHGTHLVLSFSIF